MGEGQKYSLYPEIVIQNACLHTNHPCKAFRLVRYIERFVSVRHIQIRYRQVLLYIAVCHVREKSHQYSLAL
jgi:hypothetical protein